MLIGQHSFNDYKCELKSETSVSILILFIRFWCEISSGLHQRSILMADAHRDKTTLNGENLSPSGMLMPCSFLLLHVSIPCPFHKRCYRLSSIFLSYSFVFRNHNSIIYLAYLRHQAYKLSF